MGGGKAGGSGAKTYNYHGTLCIPIRAGIVDNLHAVLVDGKAIWEGSVNRSAGNPYTIPLSDPKWLLEGGYLKIYWGESTQTTPDAALTNHPPYRGIAYVVAHKFLFGRERTAAPNIEFIVDAEARPDASIISTTASADGCVNPWAAVVEILTAYNGLGFPVSRINAASFQAAHDALAASADYKALTYCAPLFDTQEEARRAISDILAICEGDIRWDKDGKLEAVQLNPNPGSLSAYTALDATAFESPPKIDAQSWDDVPTGCVVRFRDRDRQWKEASVAVDDVRTAQVLGETRRVELDRTHINRRDQALAIGHEWVKRFCQPILSGSITVRPSKAVNPSGTPLRRGDRFLVDIDPEPGGTATNMLARVESRRFGPTGPVEITWKGEPNQPTFVSTPSYTTPTQPDLEVPEITQARIITLPLSETQTPVIFALASRPGDLVTGFRVEFDVDLGSGTFATIGSQTGFAVRGKLKADYSDTDSGDIDFEVLDTRDESILSDYVGGESLAQNDDMLLIVYKTASGFIDQDASNIPKLEVFSISAQATTAAQRYDLTTIRGRKGTIARSWNTNDEAWIVRGASLVSHAHAAFKTHSQEGTDLVIRLRPYTHYAEFDGVPDDLDFHFPAGYLVEPEIAWTTPATAAYTLASSGDLTPAATITDLDGNLVKVELYSRRLDTGVTTTHLSLPVSPKSSQTLADAFTAAGTTTPLNFPGQVGANTTHVLTCRATDAQGNVIESSRTLTRPPTSGSTSAPAEPTLLLNEPFENLLSWPRGYDEITVVSPATRIHWAKDTSFSASPPGSYTTTVALTVSVTMYSATRLWARASDGTNHSSWIYADYNRA